MLSCQLFDHVLHPLPYLPLVRQNLLPLLAVALHFITINILRKIFFEKQKEENNVYITNRIGLTLTRLILCYSNQMKATNNVKSAKT